MKRVATLMTILLLVVLGLSAKKYTLVIDPGHGGHDAGACGAFSKEKNINLNVALAFGKLVEQNCPDVKVVYTRKTDVFIPLNERANIANKAKADLFISVHTNALPAGRVARGFEVYTLGMHRAADNLAVAKRENSVILVEKDYKQRYQGFDPNSSESYIMFELMQDKNMAQSVELAKMIQNEVCSSASRPNKGVHQAGFLVLRATGMPSCLVELGFITTPDEERLLNSKSGIDAHARGLYRAFVRYCGKSLPAEQPVMEQPSEPVNHAEPVTAPTPEPATAPASDPIYAPVVGSTHLSELPQPIFKVQIMASDTPLRTNDARFKGVKDIDSYSENGWTKYTVGASVDYNEIERLRKKMTAYFPQAFIVAFKNGQKMDIKAAIREFKKNK